jgi:hypothetical protein
MDVETLKADIAQLKALTAEKEQALYRAEQRIIAADNAALASMLEVTTHPLICSFCGMTLVLPPTVGMTLVLPPTVGVDHQGCFTTGYWAKGFRKHSDWVRDCIENGKTVEEFYRRGRVQKNLSVKQENGERPDKDEV